MNFCMYKIYTHYTKSGLRGFRGLEHAENIHLTFDLMALKVGHGYQNWYELPHLTKRRRENCCGLSSRYWVT